MLNKDLLLWNVSKKAERLDNWMIPIEGLDSWRIGELLEKPWRIFFEPSVDRGGGGI